MIRHPFLIFIFLLWSIPILGEPIKEDKKINPPKTKEVVPAQTSWEAIPTASQPKKEEIPYEDVTHEIKIEQLDSPLKDYSYASFGKPDPFFPPLITNKIKKIEIPITSILQKYALAQIQVAGIWTLENKEKRALLTAANSEGVIVSVGDPVGIEGGKISRIEPDAVMIQSMSLDPEGVRVYTEAPLWLGGSHAEAPSQDKIIKTIYSNESSLSRDGNSRDFLDNTQDQISREKNLSKEASSFISQGHTEKPASSIPTIPTESLVPKASPEIDKARTTSPIKEPSANDMLDPEDQKYQKELPLSAIQGVSLPPAQTPTAQAPNVKTSGEVQQK